MPKPHKTKKKVSGKALWIAFFVGVIVGITSAPPKTIHIGCNSGNNTNTYHWDDTMDTDEAEEVV